MIEPNKTRHLNLKTAIVPLGTWAALAVVIGLFWPRPTPQAGGYGLWFYAAQGATLAGVFVLAYWKPSLPLAGWIERHPIVKQLRAAVRNLQQALDRRSKVLAAVGNFWDLGLKEEVRLGSHVIQAAINARNHPHIVYSSGLGAEKRQNVAVIDGKAILEEKLRRSGLPFTILRPGLFMDDFRGASLPFARPIQKLLDGPRLLVGRLFLATLRAVVPKNCRIPLTTLSDVGRMAAWAFEHHDESQGKSYEVIGSNETAETLCALWIEVTGQSIPQIPGMTLGTGLGHPKLGALLRWLGQENIHPDTTLPYHLEPFVEWLNKCSSAAKCSFPSSQVPR